MTDILISAGEMAEVYAWLAHGESPSGLTGYRSEEKKRRISFRYRRPGIRRADKPIENYLKEGGI